MGLAQLAFGPSSFEAHMALAKSVGAQLQRIIAGTELDIDTLDDLAWLDAIPPGERDAVRVS